DRTRHVDRLDFAAAVVDREVAAANVESEVAPEVEGFARFGIDECADVVAVAAVVDLVVVVDVGSVVNAVIDAEEAGKTEPKRDCVGDDRGATLHQPETSGQSAPGEATGDERADRDDQKNAEADGIEIEFRDGEHGNRDGERDGDDPKRDGSEAARIDPF